MLLVSRNAEQTHLFGLGSLDIKQVLKLWLIFYAGGVRQSHAYKQPLVLDSFFVLEQ